MVTAGAYSTAEAERAAGAELPVVVVPPGVDTDRFVPLDALQRAQARERYSLTPEQPVILALSRLVPRKGMDVIIQAAGILHSRYPDLEVVIAGSGRDRKRLEKLVTKHRSPVRFLGRVPDEDIPGLYGMADIFAMLCRTRWGGLEQEGFGIVFLEAAAAGVPQVAGRSGGASEAVAHGSTGLVVDDPTNPSMVAEHFAQLLDNPELAKAMGAAARTRAVDAFSYDTLASTLRASLEATISQLDPTQLDTGKPDTAGLAP